MQGEKGDAGEAGPMGLPVNIYTYIIQGILWDRMEKLLSRRDFLCDYQLFLSNNQLEMGFLSSEF